MATSFDAVGHTYRVGYRAECDWGRIHQSGCTFGGELRRLVRFFLVSSGRQYCLACFRFPSLLLVSNKLALIRVWTRYATSTSYLLLPCGGSSASRQHCKLFGNTGRQRAPIIHPRVQRHVSNSQHNGSDANQYWGNFQPVPADLHCHGGGGIFPVPDWYLPLPALLGRT